MGLKFGFDAKLYQCAAGIGSTPTWVEVTHVKDLTLALSESESDVSTRAGAGWKQVLGGLREAAIDFEVPWDTADTAFGALQTAFLGRTSIGIAVMDGPVATVGSQGLWADCCVTKFERKESLGEALSVSVTLKPTYSANDPLWKTVAGS
jgi:predicted secreted protein